MATLSSKVCHFWRSLCIVRLFFPYLATPKICQNQQNQHPNKFAIIGNICNSSKRSQMTNSFPYILNGNIGKDSVWTWTFLTTLCVVTFCQIWQGSKILTNFGNINWDKEVLAIDRQQLCQSPFFGNFSHQVCQLLFQHQLIAYLNKNSKKCYRKGHSGIPSLEIRWEHTRSCMVFRL